jgi:hypothetical protein
MPEQVLQQWEYEITPNYAEYPSLATLKLFGEDGWELVSILPSELPTGRYLLYFKRPKQTSHE